MINIPVIYANDNVCVKNTVIIHRPYVHETKLGHYDYFLFFIEKKSDEGGRKKIFENIFFRPKTLCTYFCTLLIHIPKSGIEHSLSQ